MSNPRRDRAVSALARSVVSCLALGLVAACTPGTPPTPVPSPSPTLSTPAPATPDYTEPGAARAAITELIAASGSTDVVMVAVKRSTAAVSVLVDGHVQTWAFRQGKAQQVQTDLTFVEQSTFAVDAWAIDDVGALFRAARAVSGSDSEQELQIVDASAGQVRMTVSTNPESRTVFFNTDGTLLEALDLTSDWGLAAAYDEVTRGRSTATEIGFSHQQVYLDHPDLAKSQTVRRTRTTWVPLTIVNRSGSDNAQLFTPPDDLPERVWRVLEARRQAGTFQLAQPWSCVVRLESEGVRMRFTAGTSTFVTDAQGHLIS